MLQAIQDYYPFMAYLALVVFYVIMFFMIVGALVAGAIFVLSRNSPK